MDNEIAVMALCEYLYQVEEPELHWDQKDQFEEVCFARWAAGELINAIMDHPMVSAEDTIEEFAIKMTAYSALSHDTDAGRIFKIAANFAYDTLEIFMEEYERL